METGKLFVFILLVFCVRQSTSKTKRSKKGELIINVYYVITLVRYFLLHHNYWLYLLKCPMGGWPNVVYSSIWLRLSYYSTPSIIRTSFIPNSTKFKHYNNKNTVKSSFINKSRTLTFMTDNPLHNSTFIFPLYSNIYKFWNDIDIKMILNDLWQYWSS